MVAVIGHEPPVLDGVQIARELRGRVAPVLLLDEYGDRTVDVVLGDGGGAILDKEYSAQLLAGAIRSVVHDATVIVRPATTQPLTAAMAPQRPTPTPDVTLGLSKREVEVLRHVAHDLAKPGDRRGAHGEHGHGQVARL